MLAIFVSSLIALTSDKTFEERLRLSLNNVECHFIQISDSPIFGISKEKGQIFIGKGGQFRMDYDSGISLFCDGSNVIQYDRSTRTATRSTISDNVKAHKLWMIFSTDEPYISAQATQISPDVYSVEGFGERPEKTSVQFTFENSDLVSIQWVPNSGGTQLLHFTQIKSLQSGSRKKLSLVLPGNTRWSK
ncbi:MAG: LolA family protein [Holophagaceae bacterium]